MLWWCRSGKKKLLLLRNHHSCGRRVAPLVGLVHETCRAKQLCQQKEQKSSSGSRDNIDKSICTMGSNQSVLPIMNGALKLTNDRVNHAYGIAIAALAIAITGLVLGLAALVLSIVNAVRISKLHGKIPSTGDFDSMRITSNDKLRRIQGILQEKEPKSETVKKAV